MISTMQSRAAEVRVHSHEEWPQIAPLWAELFASSSRFSFFLSKEWVEAWIVVFGERLKPLILLFEADGVIQGACLVVKSEVRQALLPVRRVSLNTSGEAACEATYPEFNDLLCRSGAERTVARALAQYLRESPWDELRLDRYQPGPGYEALRAEFGELEWEEEWRSDYYVDLAAIRKTHRPFSSVLGKATRETLNRNRRHYSKAAPVAVETASTVEAALSFLEDLAELSRRRLDGRGKKSVFFSERFLEFHRQLIRRCFAEDTVRLIRVSTAEQVLGMEYLIRQRREIFAYQCGFGYEDDPRWSPGLFAFAEVIQRLLDAGFDECCFLGGGAPYKERLSTDSHRLVSAAGRKPCFKMRFLSILRQVKRRLPAQPRRQVNKVATLCRRFFSAVSRTRR